MTQMTHPYYGTSSHEKLTRRESAEKALRVAEDLIDTELPLAAKAWAVKVVLDQWNTEQERDPFRALIAIVGTEDKAYAWMEAMLSARDAKMLTQAHGEGEDEQAGRGHRDDSGQS